MWGSARGSRFLFVRPEHHPEIYTLTVATKTDERRCACGTVLSQSNRTAHCNPCTRARMDADLQKDVRGTQVLKARAVVGVYTRPDQFADPKSYLAALGDRLNEMCVALGLPVLDVEEAPW